jgi:hypothetical protein
VSSHLLYEKFTVVEPVFVKVYLLHAILNVIYLINTTISSNFIKQFYFIS